MTPEEELHNHTKAIADVRYRLVHEIESIEALAQQGTTAEQHELLAARNKLIEARMWLGRAQEARAWITVTYPRPQNPFLQESTKPAPQ